MTERSPRLNGGLQKNAKSLSAPPTQSVDVNTGTYHSELDPLMVVQKKMVVPKKTIEQKLKEQIQVNFEKQDLSPGSATFGNLMAHSPIVGFAKGILGCHANVDSRFFKNGREVPMTKRYHRTWEIRPLPGADVGNLTRWRIVGLEQHSFLPLSPFRLSDEKDNPDLFFPDYAAVSTRRYAKDVPGFMQLRQGGSGTLQEFIAGNDLVGGVYYQIYVFFDGSTCRVVDSVPIRLDLHHYRAILERIGDPTKYRQLYGRKLLFHPRGLSANVISDIPEDFELDAQSRDGQEQ